jgi:hypothetical protein
LQKQAEGKPMSGNFHSALTPNHEGRIKMAKAKSVHSTSPTNTSAIDDQQSPAKAHTRRVLGTIATAALGQGGAA